MTLNVPSPSVVSNDPPLATLQRSLVDHSIGVGIDRHQARGGLNHSAGLIGQLQGVRTDLPAPLNRLVVDGQRGSGAGQPDDYIQLGTVGNDGRVPVPCRELIVVANANKIEASNNCLLQITGGRRAFAGSKKIPNFKIFRARFWFPGKLQDSVTGAS